MGAPRTANCTCPQAQLTRRSSVPGTSPSATTNSVVFSGPHWISIYRPGYAGDVPPLEMRLQTRFAPDPAKIPQDVPVYRTYPLSFIGRLIGARIAMLFGR